jgi:hypothetical protein
MQRSRHRQWAVEDGQTDDFRPGNVRAPPLSSLKEAREKNSAGVKMRLKDCSLPAVVDWRFVRFLLRETDLILHF